MKETTDTLSHIRFFICDTTNTLFFEGYSQRLNNEYITVRSPVIKILNIIRTEFEVKKFDFIWIPICIIVTQSGHRYNVISVTNDSLLRNFLQHLIESVSFSDYLCSILQNGP
jgi:hypothetical protein